MRACWIGLLGVIACGDAPTPPPPGAGDHGSGTRLRAMVLRTDDGLTVFQGEWFDTELDVACSFDHGRCLPRFAWQTGYRDPGCTEPLYVVDTCDDVPRSFVEEYEPDEAGCGGTLTVRRVGALAATGGDTVYGPDVDGDCVEIVATGDLHAAGEIVPLTTFVAIERAVSSGRPRAVYQVASDGAYQLDGWEEAETGSGCWAQAIGDDVLCVPNNAPWVGSTYADDGCAIPLAVSYSDECAPPPVVAFCEGCAAGEHFVELGEAWDGSVYGDDGSSCAVQPRSDGAEYLELGAVHDEARVGRLTRELATGTSPRVQPSWVDTNEEGYRDVSRGQWYDTMLDAPCYFYPASDGAMRCLVLENYAATYFSDPGCILPVHALPAGPDPAPAVGYWYDGATCSIEIASLGAPVQLYGRDSTGACVLDTGTYYPLEAEIDPAMFVEATPMVE